MVAQDYWALSPVIAMATLAIVLLSADALLAENMFGGRRYGSKRALSWIAVIGLASTRILRPKSVVWLDRRFDVRRGRLRQLHRRPLYAVLPIPDNGRDGRSALGISAISCAV